MTDEIQAFAKYKSNAELILAAHKLGFIPDGALVLDATWHKGLWWRRYHPERLVRNSLSVGSPDLRFDFRRPPFAPATFDVVAYDPPYKLNGTPDKDVDERYGVEVPTPWQERMELICAGFMGLAPLVKRNGFLLAKVQDQVCSGKVRWQTKLLWEVGRGYGLELVDELHKQGGRVQPEGRRQLHARHGHSTLMVFRKIK